jgi:hypothetical protein
MSLPSYSGATTLFRLCSKLNGFEKTTLSVILLFRVLNYVKSSFPFARQINIESLIDWLTGFSSEVILATIFAVFTKQDRSEIILSMLLRDALTVLYTTREDI